MLFCVFVSFNCSDWCKSSISGTLSLLSAVIFCFSDTPVMCVGGCKAYSSTAHGAQMFGCKKRHKHTITTSDPFE